MNVGLLGIAAAFGLASSAGLNTTLPLIIVGVLARLGLLTLNAPFDALTSDVTLIGLISLAVLEFVGDKIPALDSIVHAAQWPLAAAAGAILFASQTATISWVSPDLAIIVGVLAAGSVHAARAAARPAVTASTLGVGNPAVSLAEDGFAIGLALTSILFPVLGVILFVILAAAVAFAVFVLLPRAWRVSRRFVG